MGYARKVEDDNKLSSSSPSSVNESLLIAATMCIIGLQVHVHVKDGSVFSGIFYTASVDNGFGNVFIEFLSHFSFLVRATLSLCVPCNVISRDLNGIFLFRINDSVNFISEFL